MPEGDAIWKNRS